jgi:hypothetical protein
MVASSSRAFRPTALALRTRKTRSAPSVLVGVGREVPNFEVPPTRIVYVKRSACILRAESSRNQSRDYGRWHNAARRPNRSSKQPLFSFSRNS